MVSQRKPLRRFLLRHVLPAPATAAYRTLARSWRYVVHGEQHLDGALAGGRRPVAAFLHARTFQMLHFFTQPGRGQWLLMCSQSRDGELMSRVEERLGYEVVRGSSGAGGARALVEMIQSLRRRPGLSTCLAVDGSRGPRGVAQPGIITLARKTGGLIVPMSASAGRAWVWKHSWDRLALPKPRARVHVLFGAPLDVPRDLDDSAAEHLRQQLEHTLLALTAQADLLSGFHDPEPLRLEPA